MYLLPFWVDFVRLLERKNVPRVLTHKNYSFVQEVCVCVRARSTPLSARTVTSLNNIELLVFVTHQNCVFSKDRNQIFVPEHDASNC